MVIFLQMIIFISFFIVVFFHNIFFLVLVSLLSILVSIDPYLWWCIHVYLMSKKYASAINIIQCGLKFEKSAPFVSKTKDNIFFLKIIGNFFLEQTFVSVFEETLLFFCTIFAFFCVLKQKTYIYFWN